MKSTGKLVKALGVLCLVVLTGCVGEGSIDYGNMTRTSPLGSEPCDDVLEGLIASADGADREQLKNEYRVCLFNHRDRPDEPRPGQDSCDAFLQTVDGAEIKDRLFERCNDRFPGEQDIVCDAILNFDTCELVEAHEQGGGICAVAREAGQDLEGDMLHELENRMPRCFDPDFEPNDRPDDMDREDLDRAWDAACGAIRGVVDEIQDPLAAELVMNEMPRCFEDRHNGNDIDDRPRPDEDPDGNRDGDRGDVDEQPQDQVGDAPGDETDNPDGNNDAAQSQECQELREIAMNAGADDREFLANEHPECF